MGRSALFALFLVAFVPAPATATTAPGQTTVIKVRLSDTGILIQFHGEEARGVIATYQVVNEGRKPHSFSMFGHTTPVLKPGGRTSFTVTLVHRGLFPYRSTVDGGKAFRGDFIVY